MGVILSFDPYTVQAQVKFYSELLPTIVTYNCHPDMNLLAIVSNSSNKSFNKRYFRPTFLLTDKLSVDLKENDHK